MTTIEHMDRKRGAESKNDSGNVQLFSKSSNFLTLVRSMTWECTTTLSKSLERTPCFGYSLFS